MDIINNNNKKNVNIPSLLALGISRGTRHPFLTPLALCSPYPITPSPLLIPSSPHLLHYFPNPNTKTHPIMINLYRKSLYSFMSFADTFSPKTASSAAAEHPLLGLGLISDNNLTQFKSPNILESSSVLKPLCSSPATPRQDPGGVGFLDAVGSGVDGLMSCTESLGFESSDERLVNDEMMGVENGGDSGGGCTVRVRRRRVVVRRFPPPLTSLNQHGHPNFYLRSVRKDGRLELTEVKIERTEILRACREDGRLRLHLIKDEDEEEEDRIEEEEVEEDGFVKEGQVEFRRCVEVVNHQRRREHHRGHLHRNLDVWRQHCVTTS